MEMKGKLRLNDELERTQKEALLQYLTRGSEEIPQTFAMMAPFLTRYRNADIMDWPLVEIFVRNIRDNTIKYNFRVAPRFLEKFCAPGLDDWSF